MSGQEEVRLLEGPKVPFAISLVAGILIMATGILGLFGLSLTGTPFVGPPTAILLWILIELVCSIIISTMAFMLYAFPKYAFQFSLVAGILAMAAAILGLAGFVSTRMPLEGPTAAILLWILLELGCGITISIMASLLYAFPKYAFQFSLVAGILVTVAAILGLTGFGLTGMQLVGSTAAILLWILLELACGIIIFTMASMLYTFPKYAFQFGVVVIVVSVISFFFFGFGFFLIGLFLGVLGGSLAVTWKPSRVYPPSRSCLFEISVECPTRKVDPEISITTLSEKVCPVCPIRIRMGLEGEKPAKLTNS